MTAQDILNWCETRLGQAVDFDNAYGAQCFDLFNYIYQYVTGRSPYTDGYGVEGAKDIFYVNNPRMTVIKNNPNDATQLPQAGDILIHNGNLPGSGGYGHVSIVISATLYGYWVYEQNWGGMYIKKQYHPWGGYETGWLRFKNLGSQSTQGGASVDTIKSMYWRLMGREADQGGINTYLAAASQKGWEFVYNDLKNSAEGQADWDRRNPSRVSDLERGIADRDAVISQLQTALQNEQNKPPKEVIKEVEKIVTKEVPVDVVKEVPVYVNDEETRKTVVSIKMMLVNFIGYVKSKLGR